MLVDLLSYACLVDSLELKHMSINKIFKCHNRIGCQTQSGISIRVRFGWFVAVRFRVVGFFLFKKILQKILL